MVDPAHTKVLALIMAGGAGGRLEQLTAQRAKPALPYGGVYHLIDFPLSNCSHSGISDVWVVQQYQPFSLEDHMANGRPWDLDRTNGGLLVLHPHEGDEGGGFHQGTADAIYRNAPLIRDFAPDAIIALSSDHIYKLDYAKVVAAHLEAGADVTMVSVGCPPSEQPNRFGVVEVGDDGWISGYQYKPEEPASEIVTTEVFVFAPDALLEHFGEAEELEPDSDGVLGDFGDGLLPLLVANGKALDYRLDGYWRDVGTLFAYWASHMDLLADPAELDLDDLIWPILTKGAMRGPATVYGSSKIETSLISPGAAVRGTVENSVLAPGVVVEHGAVVRDSVILHDAVIAEGAIVESSIVDMHVRVGRNTHVGRTPQDATPGEPAVTSADQLALVGRGAQIDDGEEVPAGGRVDAAG